jgi:hypothetical protein
VGGAANSLAVLGVFSDGMAGEVGDTGEP